jgi:ankyrin repeat protein
MVALIRTLSTLHARGSTRPISDDTTCSPLESAARNGNKKQVEALLKQGQSEEMIKAALRLCIENFKENAPDWDILHSLIAELSHENSDLEFAVRNGNKKLVEILIKQGQSQKTIEAALRLYVENLKANPNLDILHSLLAELSNENVEEKGHGTLLEHALERMCHFKINKDVIQRLLEKNIRITEENGSSPFKVLKNYICIEKEERSASEEERLMRNLADYLTLEKSSHPESTSGLSFEEFKGGTLKWRLLLLKDSSSQSRIVNLKEEEKSSAGVKGRIHYFEHLNSKENDIQGVQDDEKLRTYRDLFKRLVKDPNRGFEECFMSDASRTIRKRKVKNKTLETCSTPASSEKISDAVATAGLSNWRVAYISKSGDVEEKDSSKKNEKSTWQRAVPKIDES